MAAPADYMTPALQRWRQTTSGPLLVIGVGSLPLLLLGLKGDELNEADQRFVNIVNLVLLVAFAVDYFVGLALANPRKHYVRHEWISAAIVFGQAMALVPHLGAGNVVRVAVLARALRGVAIVTRLLAIGGASAKDGRQILRRSALRFSLSLTAFTCLVSAVVFTLAEDVGEGQRVHGFGDALWWSICTVTTVGYGDVYPITPIGRMSGVLTMVVGLSALAVVTAKTAEFLLRVETEPPILGRRLRARRAVRDGAVEQESE